MKPYSLFGEFLAEATRAAAVLFENDETKIINFLIKPSRGLEHREPIKVIWEEKEEGLKKVLILIGRIEHGIF